MFLTSLKSHLFWFLAVGFFIFWIDASLNGDQDEIVVDEAVIARIKSLWQTQMKRETNSDELENLLAKWIEEEILYREAQKLGLANDDYIIRRRLVQKLNFIAEQSASKEPDKEVLAAYYLDHAQTYHVEARYSFAQIYFRTHQAARRISAQLQEPGVDTSSLGEAGMFPSEYSKRTGRELAGVFGDALASALKSLQPGEHWQGPLQSEFGWHWIRMDTYIAPHLPALETTRQRVLSDYQFQWADVQAGGLG